MQAQNVQSKQVAQPLLQKGYSGQSVRLLQQLLASFGYKPIGSDGIFGDQTESRVKEFQSNNGLVKDGTVGQRTWDILINQIPTAD
ncbi:MAG: peptidoglycan-binding protein [Cyanomargarita calcarea GSE-NOS-MK-12-04C]|jgi:peptidoglycan hydrolase-like protein with peptidoglycan-binding domain|uniref:Peptidoglycan-binding protein n=1 Tax=Cyanomargarita calcarea GSE-NOS-MK-12-04C TaxID=2839659 RepID=A0A951QNL5_9CYAN|nr:peptidoglycan-binding protein [Cyanomargarita calcarea GSE-NOS-MK-12-04C]